jgi:hypothetical protein
VVTVTDVVEGFIEVVRVTDAVEGLIEVVILILASVEPLFSDDRVEKLSVVVGFSDKASVVVVEGLIEVIMLILASVEPLFSNNRVEKLSVVVGFSGKTSAVVLVSVITALCNTNKGTSSSTVSFVTGSTTASIS